jgi:CheY-like chemotaxis protein
MSQHPNFPPVPPTQVAAKSVARKPRLLVVDTDRASLAISKELATSHFDCLVRTARTLAEARAMLATEPVDLLLTDAELPDGSGLDLVADVRKQGQEAGIILTGKKLDRDSAIDAFRAGATDVIPKPATASDVAQRVVKAFGKTGELARHARRIDRLKTAVKRLGDAKRTVGQKVDLLCNDLVSAYGELSRQMDAVRRQEDFRKLLDNAKDLEQLLCHAMDWIMRRVGYSNIAVFLAADDQFQLGAYVKYTVTSSPELTEALRHGLLNRVNRDGFVRLSGEESTQQLTATELRFLRNHAVIAANCTYLGESLASVILFRDGSTPFSNEDAETFKAIAPVFAIALAASTRGDAPGETTSDDGVTDHPADDYIDPTSETDSPPPTKKRKPKQDDADWWKRGEAPPF